MYFTFFSQISKNVLLWFVVIIFSGRHCGPHCIDSTYI